jgi:hypothetical protein
MSVETVHGEVIDPWRSAASRATHPSARHVDEGVLAAIARGLAMVTVPASLRSAHADASERLLATEHYDAWLRDLAVGTRTPVRRLDAETAIAVVAGVLELELHSGDKTTSRRVPAGEVATVPAGWRFRLSTPTGPVTAVHVSSPPLDTDPGLDP